MYLCVCVCVCVHRGAWGLRREGRGGGGLGQMRWWMGEERGWRWVPAGLLGRAVVAVALEECDGKECGRTRGGKLLDPGALGKGVPWSPGWCVAGSPHGTTIAVLMPDL